MLRRPRNPALAGVCDRWGAGLAFGSIYLFLPVISGALTGTAIQIFRFHFLDFTSKTGLYLKAVATGISWDFGNIITGMVMPFYGMVRQLHRPDHHQVANPILYNHGILSNWNSAMTQCRHCSRNYRLLF